MNNLQQTIYDIARILLWPVLLAAILCLIWVLVELGVLLYEIWLRFRYRDLDALQARTLRARKAFADGKPRSAYRYLQENTYSLVVTRFLFDLIRNYQTERLEAKPLKLLQEYEFYTIKRLERTRILVRLGPMLGLMGTLIPLSPALVGLANGDTSALADNLATAFSVTVLGLLIGGIAFVISIVRDRMYAQDISDMEYLLELLEGRGGRLESGRRRNKRGIWDSEPEVEYDLIDDTPASKVTFVKLDETPQEPLIPVASDEEESEADLVAAVAPAATAAAANGTPVGSTPSPAGNSRAAPEPLSFDDPAMTWQKDEDPFADLGPVDSDRPSGSSGGGAPRSSR